MTKKEFTQYMNKIAKETFDADHIQFKEYTGYSDEKFNYKLQIANIGEPNLNVVYFKFNHKEIGKIFCRKDLITPFTLGYIRKVIS